MDNLPALSAPVKEVYLDTGELVTEYSGSEYGNQPTWTKEELVGQGIVIRGLSLETFQQEGSSYPPARSVLYTLITEDLDTDPWGMFFTDYGLDNQGKEQLRTSTIIKQIRAEFRRNGNRPFLADIEMIPSESHKGQSYWKLKRFVRSANLEPDGKVSGRKAK